MTPKPIATLILQRNLPQVTDTLVDHLKKWNDNVTDIYVIESGSDEDKLSRHNSFWANWPEAREKGLHYPRGFNYGLSELDKAGSRYEYYFLVCGDAVFYDESTLAALLETMKKYPKLGILSPLSPYWGEIAYFTDEHPVKCVWLIPHVCWLFRREYLDKIISLSEPAYMHYFYDGNNFRGYDADTELIVKAYQNNFAVAVTAAVKFYEQEDLTDKNAVVMKTEPRALHQRLMYEEGLKWLQHKYGFASKHGMRDLAKQVYEDFMDNNPEYQLLKI